MWVGRIEANQLEVKGAIETQIFIEWELLIGEDYFGKLKVQKKWLTSDDEVNNKISQYFQGHYFDPGGEAMIGRVGL